MHRGFKYRIYPTSEQEAKLARWEGVLRFLWNLGLEQWHLWMNGVVPKRWRGERAFLLADGVTQGQAESDPLVDLKFFHSKRAGHKYPSAMGQAREMKELSDEHPWIADVPYNVRSALLFELEAAWKRCFEQGFGRPQWKWKGDAMGMCEDHGPCFKVGPDFVTFPKLGRVEAVIHRPLGGKPKAITITRDGPGQWFASVMCEVEIADPAPSTKPAIGIDRGVINLLGDSEGHLVRPDTEREDKMQARIARAQRKVAKKQKGSKNRQKAIDKLARIHRTARRQREHVLHVESHRYAKSHGVIVIEKLHIKNMTASAAGTPEEPGVNVKQKAGLNRSILAAGWGKFAEMLKYKVVPEGGVVREVPAAYSSQTCSVCGVVDPASRPSQAVFCCTGCGHTEHADTNAAKVILQRGLLPVEPTGTGCGGSAKRRPKKQQAQPARARRLKRAA